ncbi:serine/threonine-protein kinase 10-like isoform X2 [Halichondria panicea]|uniref:serine/threonine-protein kinase 10-like isoform X2 n=1 Tax=Halichondria panicea TaxID=6063 RepID=UPI00312B9B46
MAFLRKLFQGSSKNKKKVYPHLTYDKDPLESWEKIGELGDGAFGKVYKAENKESGKLAALKRVPIRDETELDDFMVEIEILAECKHRNIVGMYEAFSFDSALWMFIEFCSGGAVDDIIVELDHGLSEPQIKCISYQLFVALQFLHEKGCIHRDLKAGNILLCPDGTIRLADFGVSAMSGRSGKVKNDTFIGTPYWMAPEVVVCETDKDNPYDSKIDIWSAGITLLELADMNPPYHNLSPMRVLLKITRNEPPILIAPSRWSSNFSDFLSKCLTKDPASRPPASDLLAHPFIASSTDNRPLRVLYQEVKSEVQETVEDLPEDADLLHDPEHMEETISASSRTPSVGEISTLSPTDTERSLATPTNVGPVAEVASPEPNESGHTGSSIHDEAQRNGKLSTTSSTSDIAGSDRKKPSISAEEASINSEASGPEETISKDQKYATLSRVRKFKVDGQVIQSTTKKIINVGEGNKTLRDNKKYNDMRKQDFRELKQLQREEMKESIVFYGKIKVDKEAQERKFDNEMQELEKRYEIELEAMNKRQKKEIDSQESHHIQQFRSRGKLLKNQQSKDMKRYKENQKEEEKLALRTVEVSVTLRSDRKRALNEAKADISGKRQRKDQDFSGKQAREMEIELKKILDEQKDERKTLEMRFLDARQDLRRSHTSSLWEMEQRQKQDRHQLLKQQVREAFHMQRHQMHARHQKEIELQARRDQFRLEELRQEQILQKRQLPKKLKSDHKAQVNELRKAIRNKKAANDKEKFRQLDEQYVKRSQLETELMNEKHERELETLKAELEANMRELQEIQYEKKMQLTQQETNKIKQRDEQHTQELREWRSELGKRKQKLEARRKKEKALHLIKLR